MTIGSFIVIMYVMTNNEWLTTDELAARWGVTRRAVQKQCQRGNLPAEKLGRDWVVHADDVAKYEAERGLLESEQTS